MTESLNQQLPSGIRVEGSWKVPVEVPALNGRVRYMTYAARLPQPVPGLEKLVREVMALPALPVVRLKKGKERTLDLKDYLVHACSQDEQTFTFTLALKGEQGSARPQEVLKAFLDMEDDLLADGLEFGIEMGSYPTQSRILVLSA